MQPFTYSHMEKRSTHIKNPKWRWYKPWIKPVVKHEYWERFVREFEAIDSDDAVKCFKQFKRIYFPTGSADDVCFPQMVHTHSPVCYMDAGTVIEKGRTNLIPNSEDLGRDVTHFKASHSIMVQALDAMRRRVLDGEAQDVTLSMGTRGAGEHKTSARRYFTLEYTTGATP